jgi:cytochrome P450
MSNPVGLADLPQELQTYLVEFMDQQTLLVALQTLPAAQARARARVRLQQMRAQMLAARQAALAMHQAAQDATDALMEAVYNDQFGGSG